MTDRTCTEPGCDTSTYAKSLCRPHYRRTLSRTPDIIEQVPCDECGTLVPTPKRAKRYSHRFCSYECRTLGLGKLPAPARKPRAPRPPKPKPAPRMLPCAWCANTFAAHSLTNIFCSPRCKDKAKRVRRRGREYDAAGTYTWTELTRLWLTFGKACAYCSTPTPLDAIQAEHVTPLSRSGRNDIANLLPSCLPCNADKRDLLLNEWATDRERRGLTPVTTTWSDTDTRYRHLALGDLTLAA